MTPLPRLAALWPPGRRLCAFGLDIGSSSVKVIELRRGPASHEVVRCAVAPVPTGAVADGAIHESAPVVQAIRRAVDMAGITRTEVVIGLCGRGLIIKKLRIQPVPYNELRDAVRL